MYILSIRLYPGIVALLGAVLLGLGPPVTAAERSRTRTVTPQSVATLVRAGNPHLSAARLLIEEARGRHRQSGLLPHPEIETTLDHDLKYREVGLEVGISQAFPVTARLRLEKEVSKFEIGIAEAEVDDVERKLIGEAQEAVIRHLASAARANLLRDQVKLVRALADSIAAAAAKGEGSILDAGQAKLEASQMSLQLRQIEADSTRSLGEIRKILGVARKGTIAVSGSLSTPSPRDASPLNPRNRADYRAALLAMEAAGSEVELEKARRAPDLTAGIFAGFERREDAPEGLSNEGRVGVKLSIPIPFWDKNEGAVHEKSAKRFRMQKQAAAIASEIYHESRTAREEMGVHLKLLNEIDDELLPLASKQVADTKLAYEKSQTTLQNVLRSREGMLQLKSARLDALRDANLSLIRYQTAIGIHSKNFTRRRP